MFCPYVRNGYMRTTLIKYDGKCNYKMEERK